MTDHVRRRVRACVAAIAGLAALAGCGTPWPKPGPAPAAITPPDGGVLLKDYGLTNAPANIAVPKDLQVSGRVDQPNVVTLLTTTLDADVPGYLRPNLAQWGYRIEADANGSLIFTSDDWEGAWTCSDTLCGLTVRNLKAAPVTRGS